MDVRWARCTRRGGDAAAAAAAERSYNHRSGLGLYAEIREDHTSRLGVQLQLPVPD